MRVTMLVLHGRVVLVLILVSQHVVAYRCYRAIQHTPIVPSLGGLMGLHYLLRG